MNALFRQANKNIICILIFNKIDLSTHQIFNNSRNTLTRLPVVSIQRRNMSITLWVINKIVDICALSSVFALCEYFNLFSARNFCRGIFLTSPFMLLISEGINIIF